MNDGGVTTLSLPDGGTLDIPLPGSKARMSMRSGVLGGTGPGHLTLIVGVVLGVAVGVAATAWYFRAR